MTFVHNLENIIDYNLVTILPKFENILHNKVQNEHNLTNRATPKQSTVSNDAAHFERKAVRGF